MAVKSEKEVLKKCFCNQGFGNAHFKIMHNLVVEQQSAREEEISLTGPDIDHQ